MLIKLSGKIRRENDLSNASLKFFECNFCYQCFRFCFCVLKVWTYLLNICTTKTAEPFFFFFKEASSSHSNNSYATVYFLVLIAGSQLLIPSQWTTADSNHILIQPVVVETYEECSFAYKGSYYEFGR